MALNTGSGFVFSDTATNSKSFVEDWNFVCVSGASDWSSHSNPLCIKYFAFLTAVINEGRSCSFQGLFGSRLFFNSSNRSLAPAKNEALATAALAGKMLLMIGGSLRVSHASNR